MLKCDTGGLLAAEVVAPKFVDFAFLLMRPGLDWIARWMPLFYVPTLMTLPLSVVSMDPTVFIKMLAVVALGFPVSLAFTALCCITVRKVRVPWSHLVLFHTSSLHP